MKRAVVLAAAMQIVVMGPPVRLATTITQQLNTSFSPLLAPISYCGQLNVTLTGTYNVVDPRPGCSTNKGVLNLADNTGGNTLIAGAGMQLTLVNGSTMWSKERYNLSALPGELRVSGSRDTMVQFKGTAGWQTALTIKGAVVTLAQIQALH